MTPDDKPYITIDRGREPSGRGYWKIKFNLIKDPDADPFDGLAYAIARILYGVSLDRPEVLDVLDGMGRDMWRKVVHDLDAALAHDPRYETLDEA